MAGGSLHPLGLWRSGRWFPAFTRNDLREAVHFVREPVHVVRESADGRIGVARGGDLLRPEEANGVPTFPLLATLPALYPEWLGDRSFNEIHGTRFPYIAGAMANGITTSDLVVEMARAGMLGFFGAAGLTVPRIAEGLDRIEAALGRERVIHWGPRTVDLDILFWGDLILNTETLTIPHPGACERLFVLEPLVEIAPDLADPRSGQKVSEILASLRS